MKRCAFCGGMLQDDYKICPYCGSGAENAVPVQRAGEGNTPAGNYPYQPPAGVPQNMQLYVQPPAPVPQNMQPYVQPPAPVPLKPSNGVGVAGMVIGIIAYVFCAVPVFGFVLSLIGVILSGTGLSRMAHCRLNGCAIAGIILSIFALMISLIVTIALLTALGMSGA